MERERCYHEDVAYLSPSYFPNLNGGTMVNVTFLEKTKDTELGCSFQIKDYTSKKLEFMYSILQADALKTLGTGKVYEVRAKLVGFHSDFGRGPVDTEYGIAWYRTEDDNGNGMLPEHPIFGPISSLPESHQGATIF